MSGEYWRQIEAAAKSREKVRQRSNEQKLRVEEERLSQERRLTDELLEAREAAITLIQSIFEDVRRHSPEIRRAPMSIVERDDGHTWYHRYPWSTQFDVVALKWGNKLALTDDEEKFIKANEFWKEIRKKESKRGPIIYSEDLSIGRTVPDEIVVEDYKRIAVFISDQEILPPVVRGVTGSQAAFSSFGIPGFVANPSRFLAIAVPSLLSEVEPCKRIEFKYAQYWRDPHYSTPSRDSAFDRP